MDHHERIARAEAFMETNRQDIDRLYQAISELRKLILERTDHLQAELVAQRNYMDKRFDDMDKRFTEQRDYVDRRFDGMDKRFTEQRNYVDERFAGMDKRFTEQRDYMEKRFDEQRKFMEDGLKEVRREASINQRWMIGLTPRQHDDDPGPGREAVWRVLTNRAQKTPCGWRPGSVSPYDFAP